MNTTNVLSVRFFIKHSLAKNGRAPIYARITVEGQKADVSLKRKIDLANWDYRKSLPKSSREEGKSINVLLERVRTEILNEYTDLKY